MKCSLCARPACAMLRKSDTLFVGMCVRHLEGYLDRERKKGKRPFDVW
jgi:hypothetical protein